MVIEGAEGAVEDEEGPAARTLQFLTTIQPGPERAVSPACLSSEDGR
jgi:hypothetical protein